MDELALRAQMIGDAHVQHNRQRQNEYLRGEWEKPLPGREFRQHQVQRDSRPNRRAHNVPLIQPIRELRAMGRSNTEIARTLHLTAGRVAGIRRAFGLL